MIFEWETEDQRLLKYMRIPAQKKLEWLKTFQDFQRKHLTAKSKRVRQALKLSAHISPKWATRLA